MDIETRMADIDARIKARLSKLDQKLGLGVGADSAAAQNISMRGARAANPAFSGVTGVRAAATPSRVRAAMRKVAAVSEGQELNPMDVAHLWQTSDAELQQLMSYVCSSPHVTTNPQYSQIAEDLHFVIAKEDPTINAFATLGEFAGTKGIPPKAPMIYILNGANLYAKLISAAYVGSRLMVDMDPTIDNPMPAFVTLIGNWVVQNHCEIDQEGVAKFAGDLSLHYLMGNSGFYRKITSFSSALLIGILAHEFGHLSLGHVHGTSVNLEISRNQEREADSFASSVISSGPFGGYMVLGTVLWEMVWVWLETVTGEAATTHPLSSERLADLIRANPSAAAELGLSAPEDAKAIGLSAVATPGSRKFKWGEWNYSLNGK